MAEQDKALIELLIRVEGSDITNRIAVFELPVTRLENEGGDGVVQFESAELVRAIKKAVSKLV